MAAAAENGVVSSGGGRIRAAAPRSTPKKMSRGMFADIHYKLLPILDWTSKDVYKYLDQDSLPFHPLFDKGYVTVGDWHSSRPLGAGDTHARETRFGGLKQECGLHLPEFASEHAATFAA